MIPRRHRAALDLRRSCDESNRPARISLVMGYAAGFGGLC